MLLLQKLYNRPHCIEYPQTTETNKQIKKKFAIDLKDSHYS